LLLCSLQAVALKNQLWTYVNLYLQNPAAVQQLQAQLPPIAQGEPAPLGLLAGCPPFGTGTFMNVHLSGVNPIAELKRWAPLATTLVWSYVELSKRH
jgi:hypothetical protein